jgi:hypothetical protein
MRNTDDDPDLGLGLGLGRIGLPPTHRLYRRRRFLESVPLPGTGTDENLAAAREAAEGVPAAERRVRRRPGPPAGGRRGDAA